MRHTEKQIAEIAASNMDKMDIWQKYGDKTTNWKYLYGRVIVRRVISKYAASYERDFNKMYAKTRCSRSATEAVMREVQYASCPDWLEKYFNARYKEAVKGIS